jgi:PIN domain
MTSTWKPIMPSFTAVYDACVLFPAPLRDLLMHLALTDLFRARWTEAIHEEWIRSVVAARPDLKREQLERTRDLMNAHVMDCLVTAYESIIPSLDLPDPDDRHVLAAAIRVGAGVIVTFNLTDFPAASLEPYGIEAQHPDEFITHLLDLSAADVCRAVRRQRLSLRNPPKSVEELLDTFAGLQLPKTVGRLRQNADLL